MVCFTFFYLFSIFFFFLLRSFSSSLENLLIVLKNYILKVPTTINCRIYKGVEWTFGWLLPVENLDT